MDFSPEVLKALERVREREAKEKAEAEAKAKEEAEKAAIAKAEAEAKAKEEKQAREKAAAEAKVWPLIQFFSLSFVRKSLIIENQPSSPSWTIEGFFELT